MHPMRTESVEACDSTRVSVAQFFESSEGKKSAKDPGVLVLMPSRTVQLEMDGTKNAGNLDQDQGRASSQKKKKTRALVRK